MEHNKFKDEVLLKELSDNYIHEMDKMQPVKATALGIHSYDHLLGDFSSDAIKERIEKIKKYRLSTEEINVNNLSGFNKIEHELLLAKINSHLRKLEVEQNYSKKASIYLTEGVAGVYNILSSDDISFQEKMESINQRLTAFPDVLSEGKKNLIDPPSIFTKCALEMLPDAFNLLNQVEQQTLPGFISKTLAEEISKNTKKVKEAIEDFQKFLKEDLLKRSSGDFALGEDLFNHILENDYFVKNSPEELIALGENLFAETVGKLESLAQRIDPEYSSEELIRRLRKEHPFKKELLGYYSEELTRAKAYLLENRLVIIPVKEGVIIEETPVFYQHNIPYSTYVAPRMFDKSQQGILQVTLPPSSLNAQEQEERLQEFNFYSIPLQIVHETYPGHHLQNVYNNVIVSSNIAKRYACSLFIEGWAVYCEEMMQEAGYYHSMATQLFMLRFDLLRSLKMILDVKLHTRKISFDDAVNLLVEHVYCDRPLAVSLVKSYINNPAYHISYLIGKMEIRDVRRLYEKRRGGNFSFKEFHDQLLRYGAIPPSLIKKHLLSELESWKEQLLY